MPTMRLVNWLVDSVRGAPAPTRDGIATRNAYVGRCASGDMPHDLPPSVADIIARHATAAAAMNEFHRQLADGNINATYPGLITELAPHERPTYTLKRNSTEFRSSPLEWCSGWIPR